MAVGLTSSIVSPYKRDDTIDAAATVKHWEAVFTYGSPRSSASGSDRKGAPSSRIAPQRFPTAACTGGSRSDPRPVERQERTCTFICLYMPFCGRICTCGGRQPVNEWNMFEKLLRKYRARAAQLIVKKIVISIQPPWLSPMQSLLILSYNKWRDFQLSKENIWRLCQVFNRKHCN